MVGAGWLIGVAVLGLFCLGVFVSPAAAMGLSDTEFNFSTAPGANLSGHFRLTPSLNGTYLISTSSVFPVAINSSYYLATYKDIDFQVAVPSDVVAGEYNNNYIFVSGINETASIRLKITVLPSVVLGCPAQNITKIVCSDLSDYVPVIVTNTGNKEFVCDVFVDGIPMLKTENQTIQPFSIKKFDIYYAPTGSIGTFASNLTCRGTNFSVPIYLTSRDTTPPMLYNIDFKEDMVAGEDYNTVIWATDNVNISTVWAEIDGTNIPTKNYGDHYEVTVNNNETGIRVLAIRVNDTSGNQKSYSKRLRVTPYAGAYTYNLSYAQIKQGVETKKVIFSSEKPLSLRLNLLNFSYLDDYGFEMFNNRTSYVFYLIDQDNRRYDPIAGLSFDVLGVKKLYLVFSGAIPGAVNGLITVQAPPWVQPPGSVEIKTRVGAFSVIESYRGTVNKFPFECTASYAEDFANSTYSCCTTQSIFDVGDPQDVAVLLTKQQHDLIFSSYDSDRREAIQKAEEASFQRNVFMAVCIIMATVFGLFMYFEKKGIIFGM